MKSEQSSERESGVAERRFGGAVHSPSDLPPSTLAPTDVPTPFGSPHTLPPGRRSEQHETLSIDIPVLPRRLRIRLAEFFAASSERMRFYWFIQALIRHQAVRTANAMAFDLFVALIPMLGLAGWALSQLLVSSPEVVLRGSVLFDLTPAQLRGFIDRNFHTFSAQKVAPVAIVVGWWLASSAFYTMISVFEETFDCKPRTWLLGRLWSMGFALVGMTIFVVAASVGVFVTAESLGFLGPFVDNLAAWGVLRTVASVGSIVVIASFFALLYRYAVRRPGKRRRIWPGAWTAAGLGSVASLGFVYYVTNFARYALFYGGLAAIVILLLWLWIWCAAILLGAELNIALEDLRDIKAPAPHPDA